MEPIPVLAVPEDCALFATTTLMRTWLNSLVTAPSWVSSVWGSSEPRESSRVWTGLNPVRRMVDVLNHREYWVRVAEFWDVAWRYKLALIAEFNWKVWKDGIAGELLFKTTSTQAWNYQICYYYYNYHPADGRHDMPSTGHSFVLAQNRYM